MKRANDDEPFTVVAIPDIHTPAHDPVAIAGVCAWIKKRRIDAIVQVGDLLDMESISRFVKDNPKKVADGDIIEEFKIARKVMEQLVGAARANNRDCEYWQLQGNHETRLMKFADHYPMMRGLLDAEKHLGVAEMGGKWVNSDSDGDLLRFEQRRSGIVSCVLKPTDRRTEMYYGVTFVHGWKFSMHNAKATADQMPWPGPILYGHTHTRQTFTADKWGTDRTEGGSIGWLGLDLPSYLMGRPNRWVKAFSACYLSRTTPGDIDFIVPRVFSGGKVLVQ